MNGNDKDKTAALAMISTINAVDGFDPAPLAVAYSDMNNDAETRKRLPVMAQVAWFRLKYPEGRFTITVTPGKDCFIAVARVYRNYMDPLDCFLSEASASRGYLPEKPTVSPREWAQTAALGIALRNAGFGLQFHAAGESFDEPAVNELGELIEPAPAPGIEAGSTSIRDEAEKTEEAAKPAAETLVSMLPEDDPLEAAMKVQCPISKYKGKTLWEVMAIEPNALVWVANKFQGDPAISAAAKLICDHALAATA